MFRALILILFLMCSTVFAQNQEQKKEDAFKFFEYEKISKALLKEKFQSFCAEINKTNWIGWVVNYGDSAEITKREDQIKETRGCGQEFPNSRITYIRAENKNKSITEFWIVPPDGEPPIDENTK